MQLVAGAVGAVVGVWFGIPPQIGFALGSALFGAAAGSRQKGPGPGDLTAPGIQLGTGIPRPYGRVRLAVSPISISAYRATAQESGGKGSPSQVTGYTYDIDVYGIVADTPVIPVIAVVREWHNKELIFTALADSTDDSLAAVTDRYASVVDLFGTPPQNPAPLYEDRVGAVNAPANIYMHTREYAGLQCGSSKTLPQIEVEVITKGTQDSVAARTLWQIDVPREGNTDDIGFYNLGSMVYAPSLTLDVLNSATLAGDGVLPRFYEAIFTVDLPDGGSTAINSVICGYDSGTASNLYIRFGLIYIGGELTVTVDDSAFGFYATQPIEHGTIHVAVQQGAQGRGVWVNGVHIASTGGDQTPSAQANGRVEVGPDANVGDYVVQVLEARVRAEEVRTVGVGFAPPSTLDRPDLPSDNWTPLPEFLDDVITAELSLYPDFDPASIDVTDVAAIEVTGFTAVGDPARNVAELCDMFYVAVVPGYPVKFVQLGAAVVGTIPFADTGAGAGQPGESFRGLDQGDNDEISGVKAIRYPSIDRDHNPDFRRGDRLTTDGPDVQATETRVVFTDAEAKGRAITATLMARDAKDTAEFAVSDAYAAAEPIDCYTVTDREGNSYRLRIDSLTYADGVRSCRWTKDEPASLVQSGLTDLSNTPGIELAPVAVITLYMLDIPILRDADNTYGLYACCTATGNWTGARVYKSADDTTYTEVAAIANRATVGITTGALATYTGWTWDNTSTLTVTLDAGAGGVVTSATKTAIEASDTLNVAAIGAHGRWELIRFSTATLVAGTTYLLSGFLRGQRGSEQYNGTHQAGDKFVLLQETGMARIAGAASDIGAVRYYKAVPTGRSPASYSGTTLTSAEVGLKPYAPVDLTNDAGTLRWNRRSRLSAAIGLDPPLGEDSESYAVELDGVETDTVSTNAWTPVAPVSGETLLVAQRSAQVGAGHEASKAIT